MSGSNEIDVFGYLHEAITHFVNDPPDTAFQQGYLAALLDIWLDGLGLDHDEITLAAERLMRNVRDI